MIINILLYFLSALIVLYTIYLGAIFLFGLFIKNKKYENKKQENIAILIPCNNEERVIARLIDSLNNQTYQKEKYQIFVVAHNCSDDTILIAKSKKVDVIEFFDLSKESKTDAINYGINYLNKNYKNKFKYIVFFDADSVAEDNFLLEINNAMHTNCDVASGNIKSLNYNTNIISKLCSMLYLMTMNCNSIPYNYFGLPVNIYGSGVCVKYELIKDGLNTTTLVEDFEFVCKEVLNEKKFIFVANAIFKVEVPIDLKTALTQRRRWAIGDSQCFKKYFFKYLKSIKKLGKAGFKQMIDLCLNPSLIIGSIGIIICLIKAFNDKTAYNILLFESFLFCFVFIVSCIATLKKQNIPISKNIDVILLMPLWFFVSVIYAIESLFVSNVKFKKTTHLGIKDELNI